jgi:hypothetical protein
MLMILETSWLIGAPQRYGVDRFANHRCGRYGNRTLIKLVFQNILPPQQMRAALAHLPAAALRLARRR